MGSSSTFFGGVRVSHYIVLCVVICSLVVCVCLRSVSGMSNVASASGLSTVYIFFRYLLHLFDNHRFRNGL